MLIEVEQAMPRCYTLKKHVNQSKSTVKDKSVLGDGNTTSSWQPKTSNAALKRHDTPISPTEVYASICYNNTLENQSGKCFLKFFQFLRPRLMLVIAHEVSLWILYTAKVCGALWLLVIVERRRCSSCELESSALAFYSANINKLSLEWDAKLFTRSSLPFKGKR